MIKVLYYKYMLTILFGLILTHFGFSYFMSSLTTYFYREFMVDVRNLENNESNSMQHAFLESSVKGSHQPIMLFLGTSFSYGYSLFEKDVYSSLLAKAMPTYSVVNASVVGDYGVYILEKLRYLKRKKISVDTLFLEVNLFNFTGKVKPGEETSKKEKTSIQKKWADLTDPFINSYYLFYLFHPHGFYSIANLDLNRLYLLGHVDEHDFSFVPLPDTYAKNYMEFRLSFHEYEHFIKEVLFLSKDISKHVYFFISPVSADGVNKTQFKLKDIEKELRDLDAVCHTVPGVSCLNPGTQFTIKNFMNLSHFNEEGHRELSQWIGSMIEQNEQLNA